MSTTGFSPAVEGLIIARDMGKCVRCGRHVAHLDRGLMWSIHHRRAKSKGGTSLAWVNEAANGIVLCGSGTTGCHAHVHSYGIESRKAGFIVSANGLLRAEEVSIRHLLLGHVYLTDDGGWLPVEEGPAPESWGGEAA